MPRPSTSGMHFMDFRSIPDFEHVPNAALQRGRSAVGPVEYELTTGLLHDIESANAPVMGGRDWARVTLPSRQWSVATMAVSRGKWWTGATRGTESNDGSGAHAFPQGLPGNQEEDQRPHAQMPSSYRGS